jgi:hypothetical protein
MEGVDVAFMVKIYWLREDHAILFAHPAAERLERAGAVMHAIGVLRSLPEPAPQVSDDVGRRFPVRSVRTARTRYRYAGRSDRADSPPASVVENRTRNCFSSREELANAANGANFRR